MQLTVFCSRPFLYVIFLVFEIYICLLLEYCLTINLKKNDVISQRYEQNPVIKVNNYVMEVIHEFTYLGSIVLDTLSLITDANRKNRRAAITFARLISTKWSPRTTQLQFIGHASSSCCTTLVRLYTRQEQRHSAFHFRWDAYAHLLVRPGHEWISSHPRQLPSL